MSVYCTCIYAHTEKFPLHSGVTQDHDFTLHMFSVHVTECLTVAVSPATGQFITNPLLCSVWFFSSAKTASRKPHESWIPLPTSVLNLFQSHISNSGLRLQRCVWVLNYSSKPQRQKAQSPDFAVPACKADWLPPFRLWRTLKGGCQNKLGSQSRLRSVVEWEMISWIVWKSWLNKCCKALVCLGFWWGLTFIPSKVGLVNVCSSSYMPCAGGLGCSWPHGFLHQWSWWGGAACTCKSWIQLVSSPEKWEKSVLMAWEPWTQTPPIHTARNGLLSI